jgi:hypothetical protein
MDYEQRVRLIIDHCVDVPYDPANLWPEPWCEPARKDQFEISLNYEVCAGTISLAKAQGEIEDPARWRQ